MTLLLAPLVLALASAAPVDLSQFDPKCGIQITRRDDSLRVEWPADEGKRNAVALSLDPARPLFESIESGGAIVTRNVRPIFTVTTGSRIERPAGTLYLFR